MRIDIHHFVHFDDCHPRPHLRWTIGPVSEQFLTGPEQENLVLQLSDSQKCDLSISPVDKKGKHAPLDGIPDWTSSDDTVATVVASTDGLSAVVTAVDLGSCQINVSADADLGAGVVALSGALDVTVVGGQAVSLSIGTGTPTEQ